MTSRYSLYATSDIRDRFILASGLPKGIKPRYNISPTLRVPVIVSRDDGVIAEQMGWGLTPKGVKDTNSVFRYKTYNVPSEKIFTKHSWATAVEHNRCLVPANGFYQLVGKGDERRAYYIQKKDTPLFAFAGIYSSWDDAGVTRSTFSIITSDAPDSLRHIGDRMPVILSQSDEARWLNTSITDTSSLFGMLRPLLSEQVLVTEVGIDIHSPKIDSPKLITSL
jgi:putative SOS response-associated peptidase YedK